MWGTMRGCSDFSAQYWYVLEALHRRTAQRCLKYHLWTYRWHLNVGDIYFPQHRSRCHRFPVLEALLCHARYFAINSRRLYCFHGLREVFPQGWVDVSVVMHSVAGPGNWYKNERIMLKFHSAFSTQNNCKSVAFF